MSISHWIINESPAQPSPSDPGWLSVKPSSYHLSSGDGIKNVYAWAMDDAGNVSLATAASHFAVTLDTTAPVVTSFTLTSPAVTLNPAITFNITATDSTGVTGWLINESSAHPSPSDPGWTSIKPSSYNLQPSQGGVKTVYAWAKDAVGNVSALSASSHFDVTYYPPSGTIVIKKEASPYNVIPNNSTYNFGNLKPHQSTGLFFTINNTSQNDLEIISGDLNGSTYIYFQMGLPSMAFPLHTGEQVHLIINFSPKEPGTFSSVLKIQSSDPATPVFTLNLTGSIS